jgi:hypothetical protein
MTLKERIKNAKPHGLIPVNEKELRWLSKPEKQEEWREVSVNLTTATLEGWYGLLFGMNRKSKERYVLIKCKDFDNIISQLLSERTEETKRETIKDFISELECWKVAWIDRTKDNSAEYLRDGLLKMLNKDLSKLLELKEEE